MSDNFLSLLDLTARRNTDAAVGLVEEVVTYAPEIEAVMGRPIPGTFYTARVRTALTASSAFRAANAGAAIGASSYEKKRFDCFFFDSPLQVDEAIARAAEQEGDSLGSLQADEASGVIRQKAIALGQQFYQGTRFDAAGFPGLRDFLNASQVVDASGTGGTYERVWAVWMHPQGVHFLFGGNQGLDIKPWALQQVRDSNNKALMAWVSNVSGYIGLSSAHTRAVGCIKKIASDKPLTDALVADLVAKFPVGLQPNLLFMSRNARAMLQKSRTVTLFGQATGGARPQAGNYDIVAPIPTESNGIPIKVTDSIATDDGSW